jgi:uracil-DNA glycosylase
MTTVAGACPEGSRGDLDRVRDEILRCRRCPRLVAWREETAGPRGQGLPVPGFGDPGAEVFLLGLATAAGGGNRTGRAFTGNRSASFLVKGLHRTGFANQPTSDRVGDGLVLTGTWMASAVRCPPPANRPTAAERAACSGHLRAEWAALPNLRVVVALGGLAWSAALRGAGVRPAVSFTHGREMALDPDTTLLGCYHPSPQNTNTGLLTTDTLDAVLRRARALAGEARRAGRATADAPERR